MEIKQIRNRIDDYESTIQGLQAFLRAVTWRDEKTVAHEHSYGRRMTPSGYGSQEESDDLTPDAVIQIAGDTGYVVEAKRSLAANQEYWEKEVVQILKYANPLDGWWTSSGELGNHNVVGLIWIKYIKDFSTYLDEYLDRNEVSVQMPISLVEFSRIRENQEIIFLRSDWGEIRDNPIEGSLASGISIPIELLKALPERQLKFYDDKPVTEYTMVILWNDLFTSMVSDVQFDQELKAYAFEVTAEKLASELQSLYGSEGREERDRRFPRIPWVREALDAFVALDLAERGEASYLIKFKTTLRTGESGDLVDRFSRHRTVNGKNSEQTEQLDLF